MFVSQCGFNAQGEVNSSIANPASGYQGGVTGSALTPGHVQRQLVANGEVLARYGDAPTQEENTPQTNTPAYVDTADFRLQAAQIRPRHKSLDPVAYTVVGGETLKDIARNVLGDASLWWRIADANSLAVSGDGALTAGQTLTVPKLALNANSVETFQPYDPSQAMGSMDPVLPVPAGQDGCGGLGQIVSIVVSAVLIAYGVPVPIASVAGDFAGQVTNNITGAQNGLNWKSLAMSYVSGEISQGLNAPGLLPGKGFEMTVLRSMVSNTLTQGVGVVTGLQDRFDWKRVAASGLGAAASWGMGYALDLTDVKGERLAQASGTDLFVKAGLTTFAGGVTTAVARGGRISVQQVALDAFGNAVGESLAAASVGGGYRGQGTASSPYVDPDTGEHIVFGKPYEPNFPQMQQFVGAVGDGSRPLVDRSNDVLLAAGHGFSMGRGPVSIEQRGRTVYITEKGAEPSVDAMLAKAQADLKDIDRLRDEEITAALNRNSVIRETVTPIFEPFTIEVPPMLRAVAGGVGDVVTGTIVGLADLTVAPLADLAQTGLKALHGAVTGDYQTFTPLSSYADGVVNGGMGTWDGIKATGVNVFNVSPLGMIYHAGTGAYGLTTAAMNGDVRGMTRDSLGLGLNFAGAAVVPMGMTRTPVTRSFLAQAETSGADLGAKSKFPLQFGNTKTAASIVTRDGSLSRNVSWFDQQAVLENMATSDIGRQVLHAVQNNKFRLEFSKSYFQQGVNGMVDTGMKGYAFETKAKVYLPAHSSNAEVASTAIHEGIHELGVVGSQRAEVLARLAEIQHQGGAINFSTMRGVVKDVRSATFPDGTPVYSGMPWSLGEQSTAFPGIRF